MTDADVVDADLRDADVVDADVVDAVGPGVVGPDVVGPDPTDPPGVVTALSRLQGLEDRPVGEHVEVFDEVHRLLQDALATLDEV